MGKNQIAEHYNAAWSDNVVPPYILSLYAPLREIGISKSSRILDLGCGNGVLGKWLSDNFGCKVWGTEISEVAACQAKEAGYAEVAIHSLEDPSSPFPNQTFDVVILCAVVEHLFNPEEAVRKAAASLSDGGVLIVLTPNICWIVNRFLFLFGHWETSLMGGTRGHIHYFNQLQLSRLLRENGFLDFDWSHSVLLILPPNNLAFIRGVPVRMPSFLVGRRVKRRQHLWAENFIVLARKNQKTGVST